jgi:hypothetical protein
VLGLSTLGVVHTGISLVAIVAGICALARDGAILTSNRLGWLYLSATTLTALTALLIFRHGGFRIGHTFAVATLVAVFLGMLAARIRLLGQASRYVQAFSFSSTMLIHAITGSAETLTRLPPEAPLVTAANAFVFQYIIAGLVILFAALFILQCRYLGRRQ